MNNKWARWSCTKDARRYIAQGNRDEHQERESKEKEKKKDMGTGKYEP